ncbi:MAG: hypothetical protein KDD55_08175, partial [Bdellovibrionales bacterium]|nr:hypothetical protein [Bdellovibrionales bacterium]
REMNPFGTHFMEVLTSLAQSGDLPSNLAILPWAHMRASGFSSGNIGGVTSTKPLRVIFGEPIDAQELASFAQSHSPQVVAHMIGNQVASLLPEERRGAYGNPTSPPAPGIESVIVRAKELLSEQERMKETG